MTTILDQIDQAAKKELRDVFLRQGFTEMEFDKQLSQIGEVIIQSAFLKLLGKKKPESKFSTDSDLEKYIKNNFSNEEIKAVIVKESAEIIKKYLDTIGVSA